MKSINDKSITVLAVRDLRRSAEFYLTCLGGQPQHEEPGLFVQLGINGQTIRLVPKISSISTRTASPAVHISVPDITKMSEYLNLNCIEYQRHGDAQGFEQLEITDPDGYTIVMTPQST